MADIGMSVPDEMLVALRVDDEGMAAELRLAAAMKVYELGRLSSGAAAELAGIPLCVFMAKLADRGIPRFRLTPAEVEAKAERARGWWQHVAAPVSPSARLPGPLPPEGRHSPDKREPLAVPLGVRPAA